MEQETTAAEYVPNLNAEKELTEWVNPPSLEDLKRDYNAAAIDHKVQTQKIQEWLSNLKANDIKFKTKTNKSKIQPKVIRKQAEWRYPSLSEAFLSDEDIFDVEPVTAEDKKAAYQNQLLLNYQFNNKIGKVNFIDSYVRKAVNEGTVIVRVGWKKEAYKDTRKVPVIAFKVNADPEYKQTLSQLAQAFQNDRILFTQTVNELIQKSLFESMRTGNPMQAYYTGEYKEEEYMRVVANHPTVKACGYRNVVLDPSCGGDPEQAQFAIEIFDTNLSNLKKTKLYKNLDKVNAEGSDPMGTEEDTSSKDRQSFQFQDKPRKTLQVFEYWGYWDIDGTGETKPIVAAWIGNTLIRLEENPYPDRKIPFVVVPYLPETEEESIYGEPDGEVTKDNQAIIGAVTRGMIDTLAKSANGQTGIQKGILDVTNRRKFEEGENYMYNGGTDPRMAIYHHTFPELPASAFNMLQLQNNEAESLSGVKAWHGGMNSESLGNSVGGIRKVLDASAMRESSILRRLTEGMVKIGRKIIAMNSEFLSEEEVVRVTAEKFVPIRRDDLGGEFDLRLSISTPEQDNAKASELAFMLQTGGPSMDQGEVRIIRAEIARLRKMPALAKRIEEYQPQPDPLAIRKAELENELLVAQIENERAWGMNRQADAVLAMAKAKKEGSEADLKDLDFLRTKSGQAHAEKVDELQAQAEGNAKLELVKSAVNNP